MRKLTLGRNKFEERYKESRIQSIIKNHSYIRLTKEQRIEERLKDRRDLRNHFIQKGNEIAVKGIEFQINMLKRGLVTV